MFKSFAGKVFSILTNITDYHANITNGHIGHGCFFNLHGPWINIIATGQDYLWLQTAAAAFVHKCVNVLEVIVAFHITARNLPLWNWFAVQCGYDAYHIFMNDHLVGNGNIK